MMKLSELYEDSLKKWSDSWDSFKEGIRKTRDICSFCVESQDCRICRINKEICGKEDSIYRHISNKLDSLFPLFEEMLERLDKEKKKALIDES